MSPREVQWERSQQNRATRSLFITHAWLALVFPTRHRDVDRYAYLGKDESTGEPEWIDWGSKKANAEAAQKGGK